MTAHSTRLAHPTTDALLEEGAAFERLSFPAAPSLDRSETRAARPPRKTIRPVPGAAAAAPERFDVCVVGAGQAGLSVGYHLARRGLSFVILDGAARVGDAWRHRWDSLRLFTPAKLDGLHGLRFPAPRNSFPTKDEMADYLERYAARFALPVRCNTRVTRLSRPGSRYRIETSQGVVEADQVVVAMANYQGPRIPDFAPELRRDIVQLHSSEYRNPDQLREGGVLVVGAGNSGAELAQEIAKTHPVWLAGRYPGKIPFRVAGFWAQLVLVRLTLQIVFHRLLTVRTPLGRKVRRKILHAAGPLIRVKPRDLAALGVGRAPRVVGTRDGLPLLADERTLDVANVVWCTGYDPKRSWIDLPVFDELGDPRHQSGFVPTQPGLYFVGLHFLHALSSGMIHGVGRDAARIAKAVAARAKKPGWGLRDARAPLARLGIPHSAPR